MAKKNTIDEGSRDLETLLTELVERENDPELDFERFMVGVVDKQTHAVSRAHEPETPQRKYARLYRESAANRTVIGRK